MNVLASDLDRTLFPNGKWELTKDSIELFNKLIQENNIFLIYVTGRDLLLAQEGIKKYSFIEPNIFITDVGAKIWIKKEDTWVQDRDWQEQINKQHPNWDVKKIQEALKKVSGIKRQEEKNNSLFKQSYYAKDKKQVQEVTKALNSLFDETVIESFDPLTKKTLLDIMPKELSKLSAIEFIQKKLSVNEEDIIYCGDSGNDIRPLTSNYKGIVVKNADKQLRSALKKHLKNNANKIYFAQGSTLGNGYYVNGVIEGMYHFKLLKE